MFVTSPGRIKMTQRVFQCQFVTVSTQSGYDPHCYIGEIGVVAESFAGVNVGEVDFDKRNPDRRQRVPEGDAGVGECGRINDDEIGAVAERSVHAFHQNMFGIALQGLQMMTPGRGQLHQIPVDVFKCLTAVVLGFTGSQKIQVGAVQHKEFSGQLLSSSFNHGREFAAIRSKMSSIY